MKVRTRVLLVALSLAAVGMGAAPTPAAGTPLSHGPRVAGGRLAKWPGLTSSNWSGYARVAPKGAKFTYASATWTVPKVRKIVGFAASWVGIDGFGNSALIQTGTAELFGNGAAVYGAWWEILPASETVIPSLTISPGDTISAFVKNTSGTDWVISITDVTTGASFSITKTYTGPGTSAEWVQEAPTAGTTVLPLAHYREMEFSKLTVGKNFGKPAKAKISFPTGAIAMVQGAKQVSTPSVPTGGDSFDITYGRQQPTPPSP